MEVFGCFNFVKGFIDDSFSCFDYWNVPVDLAGVLPNERLPGLIPERTLLLLDKEEELKLTPPTPLPVDPPPPPPPCCTVLLR